MPKSMGATDRRPLVYGVFVLLILVAASYLFWPRSPQPDSLVLTPESVRTRSAAADMSGELAGDEDGSLTTVNMGDSDAPMEETSISDEPPVTTSNTTRISSTTTSAKPSAFEPAGAGNWVVNVGAFSNESGARTRAAGRPGGCQGPTHARQTPRTGRRPPRSADRG